MKPNTYEFEGQQRTVREVWMMVRAFNLETIRKKLEAGMTTRAQMLAPPRKAAAPSGWQRESMGGRYRRRA